jgi:hypothetical protein
MKVALNPAELRLIVDALDDKRQFQLQSGREGGAGKRDLRTLLHLQRSKRFRIVSELNRFSDAFHYDGPAHVSSWFVSGASEP